MAAFNFSQFYRGLLSEHGSNVYHFFKQDFSYSVHGAQAVLLAQQYYHSPEVLKYEQGLEFITISRKFFSAMVVDMLANNKCVMLWAKNQDSKARNWVLQAEASPGYTKDIECEVNSEEAVILKDGAILAGVSVFSNCEHSQSASYQGEAVNIGLAIASFGSHKLTMMEFQDDLTFSRLNEPLFILQALIQLCIPFYCAGCKLPSASSMSASACCLQWLKSSWTTTTTNLT